MNLPDHNLNHTEASQEAHLTPLQKAHLKRQQMKEDGTWVKPEVLNPVERALKNPNSLKMAIRAHCWTCCGAGADPGVKQSVRDCQITSCSLHPHRPWQTVNGKSADQMTEEEMISAAADEDKDEEDDPE